MRYRKPHDNATETFFAYICTVKRLIAISFLFIFLITNTVFGQLLRLPTLIHHYLEHVEWDNTTFLEFLNEHYAKEINHPDDKHNDHEKLPFKNIDVQSSQVLSIAPQHDFMLSKPVFILVERKRSIHKQQHYSNAYLDSIWQPPRS